MIGDLYNEQLSESGMSSFDIRRPSVRTFIACHQGYGWQRNNSATRPVAPWRRGNDDGYMSQCLVVNLDFCPKLCQAVYVLLHPSDIDLKR